MGIEELPQSRFKIPLRARNTAKEIETERTMLRKRVAREMRLRE